MTKPTPRDILDKLTEMAWHDAFLAASPSWKSLLDARDRGIDLPPKAKPGYLLSRLTAEEREILQGLTSETSRNYRLAGQ